MKIDLNISNVNFIFDIFSTSTSGFRIHIFMANSLITMLWTLFFVNFPQKYVIMNQKHSYLLYAGLYRRFSIYTANANEMKKQIWEKLKVIIKNLLISEFGWINMFEIIWSEKHMEPRHGINAHYLPGKRVLRK